MKKILFTVMMLLSITFFFETYGQEIKGTYAIKNVKTGMLLRIKDANNADGTPLVAYSPVNWKCVTWDFKHVDGETYILKNLFTGKTIQSLNESPSAGDPLKQRPINNSTIQQYEFIPVDKNVYLIKLKGTDLYITPSEDKATINAPVVFSKKMDGSLQQWTIYEQHPTM